MEQPTYHPFRLAMLVILFGHPLAEAAEWAAEPSITVRENYNDNIRLTTAEHDSIWSTVVDPSLALSRRSELWDLNAKGRVRASYYSGNDDLDSVDSFFDIAAKRTMERGSVQASVSFIDDTTLQDEYLDADTGLTITQIDRSQRSVNLGGEYMFTEATWAEVSAGLTKVEYENGERRGLLDYDYLTPTFRVIHQYDPKTQVFGIISHATVDYDTSSELESKTNSLQLGAAYDITETWKVSASVGSRRTKTSSLVPTAVPRPGFEFLFPLIYDVVVVSRDAESTGLVYDASVTREFETGRVSLTASQSVAPSSTGTDTDSTRVEFLGVRNLSAKLLVQLAVSYYQSSTVGDTTTRADNDRYRIAPSVRWQLDRDLALNAGYVYTAVKRALAEDDTADSNAVFVSLGYTWPRMAVSR